MGIYGLTNFLFGKQTKSWHAQTTQGGSVSEKIKWVVNKMPKSDDAHLGIMSLENVEAARSFHRSFPQYDVTPLAKLDALAGELGLTTIAQPDELLGEIAAEYLLEKIRGESDIA